MEGNSAWKTAPASRPVPGDSQTCELPDLGPSPALLAGSMGYLLPLPGGPLRLSYTSFASSCSWVTAGNTLLLVSISCPSYTFAFQRHTAGSPVFLWVILGSVARGRGWVILFLPLPSPR